MKVERMWMERELAVPGGRFGLVVRPDEGEVWHLPCDDESENDEAKQAYLVAESKLGEHLDIKTKVAQDSFKLLIIFLDEYVKGVPPEKKKVLMPVGWRKDFLTFLGNWATPQDVLLFMKQLMEFHEKVEYKSEGHYAFIRE
jgi:hypothetical protein